MPLNRSLDGLRNSPFVALRSLLSTLEPAPNLEPLALTIGEPQNQPPALMKQALIENDHLYGKYPPVDGTPALRQSITQWLNRRYKLPINMISADEHVAPVNGTKEALYMLASVITDVPPNGPVPAILMPNPYYHVYHAAAVMAGAEPIFLNATKDNNFFPDLDAIDSDLLARTSAFFLCSPSNPQGTVADEEYLLKALDMARKYDFTLIMDECYTEIYDTEQPPVGMMEILRDQGGSLKNLISFHSLSKRSSAAGLRSGFVVGDETIIKAFINLRNFGGAANPLPACAAAAALWDDDIHVEENRALYQKNISIAEKHLSNRFEFYRPLGGFFLWLNVGDGVEATCKLWTEGAVRVLPGEYLAGTAANGINPGKEYIRIALVFDPEMMDEALTRIVNIL